MNSKDLHRLEHIIEHANDLQLFLSQINGNFSTYTDNPLYFNAINMSIAQIGELANGLTEEFREETKSQIPWNSVRRMRNVLIHEYANVDAEQVWVTAQNDIPALVRFCKEILEKSGYYKLRS